jgi:hypothetical protein
MSFILSVYQRWRSGLKVSMLNLDEFQRLNNVTDSTKKKGCVYRCSRNNIGGHFSQEIYYQT